MLTRLPYSVGYRKLCRLCTNAKSHRYAAKYACPHVSYFDGRVLLLLQFRAKRADKIEDANRQVDGWAIAREGSVCPLGYALYMLLVQSFRRRQTILALPVEIGGRTPYRRSFITVKLSGGLTGLTRRLRTVGRR